MLQYENDFDISRNSDGLYSTFKIFFDISVKNLIALTEQGEASAIVPSLAVTIHESENNSNHNNKSYEIKITDNSLGIMEIDFDQMFDSRRPTMESYLSKLRGSSIQSVSKPHNNDFIEIKEFVLSDKKQVVQLMYKEFLPDAPHGTQVILRCPSTSATDDSIYKIEQIFEIMKLCSRNKIDFSYSKSLNMDELDISCDRNSTLKWFDNNTEYCKFLKTNISDIYGRKYSKEFGKFVGGFSKQKDIFISGAVGLYYHESSVNHTCKIRQYRIINNVLVAHQFDSVPSLVDPLRLFLINQSIIPKDYLIKPSIDEPYTFIIENDFITLPEEIFYIMEINKIKGKLIHTIHKEY